MHRWISCLAVMFIGAVTFFAQSDENLALREDAVPIARVTAPTGDGSNDVNIIKNEITAGESYDSYDGANVAGEDWYGYTWSQHLYFDRLVFYEGTPSAAGGYWKSLTVQYTLDGATWVEAGNVTITPEYDFSDDPDRPSYSRYELSFTGCLGIGARIYGQPGGPSCYTSIAELEVYGEKPPAICVRILPISYQPEQNIAVSLILDVDAQTPPATLTLVELIPAGLTVASAGTGDTSQPGQISWSLGEGEVASGTLSYSLAVPPDHSGMINFSGTLAYPATDGHPGTDSQSITGSHKVAPAPLPPSGLEVAFHADAHLSWSPPEQEGIAGYRVYRSEDGGDFTEISGLILDNNYVDHFVETGKAYQYKVISENATGARSDPADSTASDPAGPSMLRRQFEDYNFEGGSFPGGESKLGYRATFRSDLSFTDYFFQSSQQSNAYRSGDRISIPAFNPEEHRIGDTTPSDWWRYTFEVPETGFVKIGVIRAASDGNAIMEFLWDEWDELQARWVESHKGWFSFNTGGLHNWQIIPVDTPAFYSASAQHTLRIILSVGNADLDYFGIGFQQPEPLRTVIFSDDFESYADDDALKDIWTIIGSGVGEGEGAWRLWSTTSDPLGYYSADLPGMTGQYALSDSEFAGPGDNDEQLISPAIDCAGRTGVMVNFGSNIQVFEDDIGYYDQVYDLDVSIYDDGTQSWSDWTSVFHHEATSGDSSFPRFVDISDLADGKRIKLRWHFWKANYDYWWAVDNVRITAEEALEPGRVLSVEIAGDAISLTWESFGKGSYRVLYTDDLVSGIWSDVVGYDWPIAEEQWEGDDISAAPSRFYRVISE